MKSRALLPAFTFLATLALAAPFAAANHIDFLIDAPFASASTFGDINEVSGDPANILGGVRGYSIFNNGGTGTVSASLANGGPLVLADAGGALGNYRFSYGNQRPITPSDFNANFITAANYDRVQIDFGQVTGSGDLTVFLASGGDDFTFAPLTITSAGSYFFAYADVLAAIPTFDFTSVDGFYFQIDSAPAGLDSTYTVSQVVRAVPEPSSMLLLTLSGVAIAFRRRRA